MPPLQFLVRQTAAAEEDGRKGESLDLVSAIDRVIFAEKILRVKGDTRDIERIRPVESTRADCANPISSLSTLRTEPIVRICIQMYIHISGSTRARTCHLAKLVACTRVACVSRSERTGVQLSSGQRRERKRERGSPRVRLGERCESPRAISSVPENCRGCVHVVGGRITSVKGRAHDIN